MKKNEAILLVLPFITFLLCACNQDDPIKNPYSVFQKEYRTHGEEYEDEYYGHLTSCHILQFDKPNKADFYDFYQTFDDEGNVISGLENIYPISPTYHQRGQLVIIDYGRQIYDTLISYGDSLIGKWNTYYYYGSTLIKLDKLQLLSDSILYIGDMSYIDAITNDKNAEHVSSSCQWFSSDTTIATVNLGNVYGKKEGNVIITAYYNGDSTRCALRVCRDSIILQENMYMTEGVSCQLQYTFASQKYRYVEWDSSDENIVSVNAEGLLYAKNLGNVIVTAKAGEYIGSCNVYVNPSKGEINGHEWVDLGLSVLWASMNVGASVASDEGIACAWANPYSSGGYQEDKWCVSGSYVEIVQQNGGNSAILHHAKYSKYVVDDGATYAPHYKTDTIVTLDEDGYEHIEYDYTFLGDGKSIMEIQDDAVRQNWGDGWRIPSKDEFQELIDNCDFERVSLEGTWGYKVKSRINGKTIFFPNVKSVSTEGNPGNSFKYWTSDLAATYSAYILDISYKDYVHGVRKIQTENRSCGLAIRGVINRK